MDPGLIRSVVEAGAFENAHGRFDRSAFCSVLTPKDTAILELFEKYHRPFFQQLDRFRAVAAPLVADLAQSLRASAAQAGDPDVNAADLRFAHAETLVPLLILLGIDGNGMATDSPQYRSGLSAFSPFAANLAFELYEQQGDAGKTHFVRLRLHERYVECIPVLGEHGASGVVPLQVLLDYFDDILEEGMHFYE
ncbi:Histidine phosphatase [Gracilaria domingensis]|nr:Histidine phosphatase [Gracilaria domingensis]